jgi:hypothetical protein
MKNNIPNLDLVYSTIIGLVAKVGMYLIMSIVLILLRI